MTAFQSPLTGSALPGASQIRRTFRRILSGDDEGRPPWVKALGEPGDVGWFGPGSTVWEVNGSLATLVGGIRALLLQACHPLALAGVEQHSSYRADPLGRLQRTNLFVTTTTFGSTTLATRATERVRRVHESVNGQASDGRRYSADDPRLLMWVHVGLVDSMLVAAQRYHHTEIDGDAYVAEMAIVGEHVGVDSPPTSQAALQRELASFVDEVKGDEQARKVAKFLQFPGRALPFGAWAPYSVLSRAAVDLLPTWAHPVLRTPRRPSAIQTADRVACQTMLNGLQRVVGRYSQATLLSYERVGVDPPVRADR
ncbi:MAG TPA: oxygenase MpaB family protein [Actinomycetes bacterium]|nr:oxygenase MpaB family protein [Actinomycetes bacterium]